MRFSTVVKIYIQKGKPLGIRPLLVIRHHCSVASDTHDAMYIQELSISEHDSELRLKLKGHTKSSGRI